MLFNRARGSAWLERSPDKREVEGSNPSGPTISWFKDLTTPLMVIKTYPYIFRRHISKYAYYSQASESW